MKKETIEKMEKFNVIELYTVQKLSVNKIGEIIKSNKSTVSEYLQLQGITLKYGKSTPKFDLNLAESLYNNGKNLREISEILNVHRDTLSKYLKLDCNVFVTHNDEVQFNEHVFDEIDTEEKAYWLGFIYADGNISLNGYRLTLKLALKDLNHLEKFCIFMQHLNYSINTNKYEYDHPQCSFFVYSKHLWNTLNNYGCTPKKSLTLEFPDENIFKSKDLIRHFIRGYFDGDGCFWRDTNSNKLNFNVLGTEHMLNAMQSNFPVNKFNTLFNKHKEQTLTKSLTYKGKSAFKVSKYLYEDASIYLDRKEILYKELKSNYE